MYNFDPKASEAYENIDIPKVVVPLSPIEEIRLFDAGISRSFNEKCITGLISVFATQKFCTFSRANFSLNILPKEPKNLPLESICICYIWQLLYETLYNNGEKWKQHLLANIALLEEKCQEAEIIIKEKQLKEKLTTKTLPGMALHK